MLRQVKEWLALRRRFKPCVFYDEQSRVTEVILKDCFTVWCPLAANTGHFVDLGYDGDGQLIGVRIWGDVREQDSATRLLLEGIESWKQFSSRQTPTI